MRLHVIIAVIHVFSDVALTAAEAAGGSSIVLEPTICFGERFLEICDLSDEISLYYQVNINAYSLTKYPL